VIIKKAAIPKAELAILLAKHKDLMPILQNDKKSAEDRLTEFCVAYLTKIGVIK
jgi:hypothetical protein